jgi:hypothetical protein
MEKEGALIWERNCSLNRQGTRPQSIARGSHEDDKALFFSRRHKYRVLKRYVNMSRQFFSPGLWTGISQDFPWTNRFSATRTMSWVVKLSRRPWAKDLFRKAPALKKVASEM